mmetsp:Transcript_7095/g.12946  ORF Transcript_7095/g.12946 Transcript_7095/m.12946 type:complete len:172 (-) Transcript_7095:589-1104(-)
MPDPLPCSIAGSLPRGTVSGGVRCGLLPGEPCGPAKNGKAAKRDPSPPAVRSGSVSWAGAGPKALPLGIEIELAARPSATWPLNHQANEELPSWNGCGRDSGPNVGDAGSADGAAAGDGVAIVSDVREDRALAVPAPPLLPLAVVGEQESRLPVVDPAVPLAVMPVPPPPA